MSALNVTSTMMAIQSSAAGSWGGTVLYLGLFVFLPIAFFGILVAVLWNLASYTKFKKYLVMFGNSFKYAILGCITIGALSLPIGLVYWGYTQAKAGNTVPFKYTFYIIGAFIILALIGKLVDKFVIKRVAKFEEKIKDGR
jgi:uncharacterized membrane protein